MGVSTWEYDARDHRAVWRTGSVDASRALSFFFLFIPPYPLLTPTPHSHPLPLPHTLYLWHPL